MSKFRRTLQRVAAARSQARDHDAPPPDKADEIMALKRAMRATAGQDNRAAIRYLKNQKRRGKL